MFEWRGGGGAGFTNVSMKIKGGSKFCEFISKEVGELPKNPIEFQRMAG